MASPPERYVRPWMRRVLLLAAAYNIAWGAFTVLFPRAFFSWIDAAPPNYPELWQCIGMIVGVYGVGYAVSSVHPLRHWPIVLVGFLGKVFGPIGFAWALLNGRFPAEFVIIIVFNDLIWLVPFYLILQAAYREYIDEDEKDVPSLAEALETRTSRGASLNELSGERPTLVLFLRHSGCTFCRDTLSTLSRAAERVRASGLGVVIVHMGTEEEGRRMLQTYGLEDFDSVSDPARLLYRAFRLRRGTLSQLFGPRVWWPGFKAGILGMQGVGWLNGDGFQLGGWFVVKNGRIVKAAPAQNAASSIDLPEALACMR